MYFIPLCLDDGKHIQLHQTTSLSSSLLGNSPSSLVRADGMASLDGRKVRYSWSVQLIVVLNSWLDNNPRGLQPCWSWVRDDPQVLSQWLGCLEAVELTWIMAWLIGIPRRRHQMFMQWNRSSLNLCQQIETITSMSVNWLWRTELECDTWCGMKGSIYRLRIRHGIGLVITHIVPEVELSGAKDRG